MFKSLSTLILTTTALSLAQASFAQTTLLDIETGKTAAAPIAAVASPVDYTVFDEMMKKVAVEQGGRPRLAYDFIREQKNDFIGDYIQYLEGQNISALTKNDQLAFWLNLQNIVVVQAVLQDGKKKKSLKKLRGTAQAPGKLWTKPRVTIADQNMSLEDIEMKILTAFDNPNVIYGIYQGVRGAPCLTSTAYRGATVTDMLAENAKRYVNSKGIVAVKGNVVEVTPVFLWYQNAAFGGDTLALNEHLKAHAYPNLKSSLYRGKSFKASSLNYRLDSYKAETAGQYDTGRRGTSGSSGGSSRPAPGGGGYGS